MPQPKKSAPSARKTAARKTAARKPGPAKATTPSSKAPKKSRASPRSKASRGGSPGAAARSTGGSARGAQARAAERREDQLLAAIAALRDVLSQGVMLTTDRLEETVDEAVRRGRMTAQDAEDLVQNLVAIGRRQSQDALAEIERVVGRSAKETRRIARERVKHVGAAARRAPGTDRALRTVDRVRRAAGLGQAFPVVGYDDLTAAQVKDRLGDLNRAELRRVRDHERRNANRKSVLTAIERLLENVG